MNITLESLGFTAGQTVFVETTPDWYGAMIEEAGLEVTPDLPADHAHLFFASKDELHEFLEEYYLKDVRQSVWFSWPKVESGIKTDLNEQVVLDAITKIGFAGGDAVDIDDVWAGLRFTRKVR